MNKKLVRGLLVALGILSLLSLGSWGITRLVVARARVEGEFDSAEAGMLVLIKNATHQTIPRRSGLPDPIATLGKIHMSGM